MIEHVLVIDLEVSGAQVREIGACLGEERGRWTDLFAAREALRSMAGRARGLAGHNAHAHDLPFLERLWPDHPLLDLPLVDTLLWSPIIRPERPYHRLVKDRALVREKGNDPLSDALGARELLADVLAWQTSAPKPLAAFARAAVSAQLGQARWAGPPRPPPHELLPALLASLEGQACLTQAALLTEWLRDQPADAYPLACLAAWLPLGPGSVLPPWVWRTFPVVRELQTLLRETDCSRADCAWCAKTRSAEDQLARWFPGFRSFRAEPALADGRSAQAVVVQAGLENHSLFAILPTGGGKSIGFQVPAFARYARTGALTVVISPLQSLMKDQVDALRQRTDNPHAFALHGGLDLLSRQEVLRAIREGEAGLLYLSPEQLRNPGARAALQTRQIGCWVIDEAHCMAEWGHDFRTDYWYAPRFIAELARQQGVSVPAIACFTATAQARVRQQIEQRIEETCRRSLQLFQAVTERSNISLRVLGTQPRQRQAQLQELLEEEFPPTAEGAAIVFCPSRRGCEDLARVLSEQGWAAGAYHAGLQPQQRREVQERFLDNTLRLIAATSAFGMGVDKADVRFVAHLAMPPSLEDYVQQVGRAGRDGGAAQAVLLWHEDDLDRALSQVQRSALKRVEVEKVRQVVRKSARAGRAELTAGELSRLALGQEDQDDRVLASLSWLERAGQLKRDENRPRVFQGRPRIQEVEAARRALEEAGLAGEQIELALGLLSTIWAGSEGGLDADDLAQGLGLRGPQGDALGAGRQVIELLERMVSAGLLNPGTLLRASLRKGVSRDSQRLLEEASALEGAVLERLSESAPDGEGPLPLNLGALCKELPEISPPVTPAEVRAVLRQTSSDRDEQGQPVLSLFGRGHRRLDLGLQAPWATVLASSRRRRAAAAVALKLLLGRASGSGKDVGVDFALEEVCEALRQDLQLRAGAGEAVRLAERAVLSLHELGVIVLQGGLAVFRTSMTLTPLGEPRKRYTQADHRPAEQHNRARQRQARAMGLYASLGQADPARGAQVIREWFSADGSGTLLSKLGSGAVTTRTRARILDPLDEDQRAVVEADPEADLVVLAGPGSGKTRTLVHRVAWLVRAHGVDPRRILVLCYNRGTVAELLRRLVELLGEDGRQVPVLTLHALAMRLCGEQATGRRDAPPDFEAILRAAIDLLRSDGPRIGLPEGSVAELLLGEWDTLLVDEVQDVDPLQAELLDALIGRRGDETDERRMAVFAVGDDDQNIYSWRGARGEYLRAFEQRYGAERRLLRFNHRSRAAIVELCNAVVAPLPDRLKEEPILAAEQGRVYGEAVREARVDDDAQALGEVRAQVHRWLEAGVPPSQIAVLARHHLLLWPLHDELVAHGIPCCAPPLKDPPDPWLLRETRSLLEALPPDSRLMRASDLRRLVEQERARDPESRWWAWLAERCADWEAEVGADAFRALDLREYLREVVRDSRHLGSFGAGVVLSTQHGAKGLEWPAVIVLGDRGPREEDAAAERRLAYVALSRARQRLHLVRWRGSPPPWSGAGAQELLSTAAPGVLHRRRRELWNLDRLYLGFAGRLPAESPVHEALRTMRMGTPLRVVDDGARAGLVEPQGLRVAQLSKEGRRLWAGRAGELRLFALVERRREQEDARYAEGIRVDRWWVPVLEWLGEPG